MGAVQSVFQTYVEALKKEGKFTEAEQRIANEKALSSYQAQLIKLNIIENFGDISINKLRNIYQLKLK